MIYTNELGLQTTLSLRYKVCQNDIINISQIIKKSQHRIKCPNILSLDNFKKKQNVAPAITKLKCILNILYPSKCLCLRVYNYVKLTKKKT